MSVSCHLQGVECVQKVLVNELLFRAVCSSITVQIKRKNLIPVNILIN